MQTTNTNRRASRTPGPARETGSRRRGAVLEDALLKAAWDELAVAGYSGLTMETVAELAGTSKSVLYRRWPTRAALVLAAVRHHVAPIESRLPDTGDLRGDLLAVLAQVREHFEQIGPAIVHGLMAERADLPEDIDAVVPGVIARLLDRAADRGQLRLVTITPLMAALPGSLLRHELLLARRPATDEFLAAVVDEIFLPLVTLRAT